MKSSLVFALLALGLILPNVYASTAQLEVNGNTHEVTYEATGLTVDGIEADTDPDLPTLIVLVSVTDAISGTLELTLDRSFFDSIGEAGDEDFLVISGGDEIEVIQSATETQRMLTITVPSGTNSLDIIGTIFGTGESAPEPETPTEEPAAPEPETPTEETPTTQCGPGTVLKDGECVLDQTCGPGTILQDGQCVLDTSAPAPTVSTGQGTQLVVGIVAAFVIALIIMMILWAIGKAGRSNN
ncbi:MAG: hypothetical protein ACT4OD_07025 [Candidatus Nitrosotenuis sp.]